MQATLYIDRDGTLIDEPLPSRQIDSLEKLVLEPAVIPALLQLQRRYRLVMVSNQDGLGSPSFPRADFDKPQEKLLQLFASQGIHFAAVYICPHRPEDHCLCRKPKTGLLQEEIAERRFDPATSQVIGDRETDLQLAQNLGIGGLLYHREQLNWNHIAEKLLAENVARNPGPPRHALVQRRTRETDISAEVWLDEAGLSDIHTGIGFFDHMLDQIATHGGFRLRLRCTGDLHIDDHHTIEDCALALGQALREALGDKRGLGRFGFVPSVDESRSKLGFVLPMDECRARCALDLSGRPYLHFRARFHRPSLGSYSTEMTEHFFYSLAQSLGATLHLTAGGRNDHHKAESLYKAFGRCLRQALRIEDDRLPSSKGVL